MTDTTQQIIKNNTVDIHGKSYLTVAGRVGLFHEDNDADVSIETGCKVDGTLVMCKASVKTKKGTFTGWSAVDTSNASSIEKGSPIEVAETSAVGRALGFAGYGVIDSIASADEMVKSGATAPQTDTKRILEKAQAVREEAGTTLDHVCKLHNVQMKERTSPAGGTYYDHRRKLDTGEWERCSGYGFKGDMKRLDLRTSKPEGLTEEDDKEAYGDAPIAEPTAEQINEDVPF